MCTGLKAQVEEIRDVYNEKRSLERSWRRFYGKKGNKLKGIKSEERIRMM